MDYKCTIDASDSFLELLKAEKERQQKVSIIIDDNGWERAEGIISEIVNSNGGNYLVLDEGAPINVAKIVAVNGVFKTDCSC
ncbi:hypothetical protein [Niabella soli]|uniref:Uncharacterized protein n=1 Tax=Niabella soli DSM 19437 TaxID=929713 RepID=W0F6I5_9BACT|nr:hypothetical protein [Niabella soli]AHF17423.1 hypothetical protein NIASO_07265 [Niabella soli DSM 19437]